MMKKVFSLNNIDIMEIIGQNVKIEKKPNIQIVKPIKLKQECGIYVELDAIIDQNYMILVDHGKSKGHIKLIVKDNDGNDLVSHDNIRLANPGMLRLIYRATTEKLRIGLFFKNPKANDFFNIKNINITETNKPTPDKRLAIIVSYRDRLEHLNKFIPHMNDFLKEFDYQIFIIHQKNEKFFNRASLFNIGFDLVKDNFDYFCFHDVDLLPYGSSYSYPNQPTHLTNRISQFDYKFVGYAFGGALVINKEQFLKINGFSNMYEGWGCEDDDYHIRIKNYFTFTRLPGYYKSLPHKHVGKNGNPKHSKSYERYRKMLKNSKKMMPNDGINQLGKTFNYKVLGINLIGEECKLDDSKEIQYEKGKNFMIDVTF